MLTYTSSKSIILSFRLLVLIILFSWCTVAYAQVNSDDNGVTQNLENTNTFSFTLPAGDDRLLVVCTQGSAVTGVTFNGNALTKAVDENITVNTQNANISLYYSAEGSSGSVTTADIVVSGTTLSGAVASSYTNVEQGAPITDVQKTSTSGAVVTSSSLTVNSSSGDMVCDCLGLGQAGVPPNPTATVNVSQTEIGQQLSLSQVTIPPFPTVDVAALAAVSRETGANTVDMDWDVGNLQANVYGLIHVAINIGQIVAPLPVELISFNAKEKKGEVELNWKTASEQNNSGFEIQKSVDGMDFYRIHFEEGKGNSFQENSYRFIDKSPIKGLNYYRLKQIDFSGKFEYSEIQSVQLESSFEEIFTIYPNPSTRENIVLEFSSKDKSNLSIEIYDTSGKLRFNKNQMIEEGENIIHLNLGSIGKGYYVVRLRNNKSSYFQKIIIE